MIDDDGNVFGTSLVAIRNLIAGTIKGSFVLMSRMPYKASADRFKKSPVYMPPGYVPPQNETTNHSDALGPQNRAENAQKKSYADRKVW